MSHTLDLTIDRLGQLGEGIGHHEGRSVFVHGAFPGDTVRIRLETEGKVHRGELLEVLKPGPGRRTSPCTQAVCCRGYDWLELKEAQQREAKQDIVLASLERNGGLDPSTFTVRPLLAAPKQLGYRRRAVLHVHKGQLGAMGRRSHDFVPLDGCPLLAEPVKDLPGKLAQALKPALKDAHEVHLLAEGDKAAFALLLQTPVAPRHVEATEAAVRALRLEGAVVVPKEGSPRLVGKPVLRSLSPLRPDVPLYLRPDAFSQAHAEANVGLVASALQELAPTEADTVLELYSGNGNFTFPIAGVAREVLGVETGPVSVQLAERSAREGRVGNVRLIQGDARKVCEGLAKEGRHFDLLLADPPRTGAPGLAQWAKALGVRRVVYVACDPASLARDGAELARAGYAAKALQVVDMFPQTHHVEAVMAFG